MRWLLKMSLIRAYWSIFWLFYDLQFLCWLALGLPLGLPISRRTFLSNKLADLETIKKFEYIIKVWLNFIFWLPGVWHIAEEPGTNKSATGRSERWSAPLSWVPRPWEGETRSRNVQDEQRRAAERLQRLHMWNNWHVDAAASNGGC